MEKEIKLPIYNKLTQIIIGIIGLFFILYIGQEIIVPLVFAFIIAILLNPVVNALVKLNVNRILSIFLALLFATVLFGGLLYFIGWQIGQFTDTWPSVKEKFSSMMDHLVRWISHTFNVSQNKINSWIEKTKGKNLDGSFVVGTTLTTLGGIITYIFLLPVYVFLILFYKPLLLEFIARLFTRNKHEIVAEVLIETKSLIQSYLIGLSLEALLVALLNSAGLFIIGIDYAILLGIIGALLNIIPYIGGIVGTALPMLIAMATKSPIDAFWVFIAYIIVQFIDNNFILPMVVAGRVKINALVSIVVVLIGGAMWGVAGMFLAVPITAILKVIFDRLEALTPFGFLFGDNQPAIGKTIFKFKKDR